VPEVALAAGRDWIDFAFLGAEVVAALAAAAAAFFAWRAIVRVERARQDDARERRLGDVQRTLLQLRSLAPNDITRAREINVLRHQLNVEHAALDPQDREQVPSVGVILHTRPTPELVSQALEELAIWRGAQRGWQQSTG
jgi:hypothetical protein